MISQKGNTMLETLAALSVVTVLGIGVIKLIGGMFGAFKLNMVVNEIQEIQKNISARYRLEGNYTGLNGKTAAQFASEQLIPSQMKIGNEIRHRQGGIVTISVSDYGGDDEYYDVTFNSLTKRTCTNLAQINWESKETTDLFRIKVNNSTFVLPVRGVAVGAANALPMTVAKAFSSCNKSDDNVITWTFK